MSRILVVDNYDSFVYNLVQYLGQLGAEVSIRRNDDIDLRVISTFDGVLISPGPGTPELAGQSIATVKRCADEKIPLLGVCLGHQAIAVTFGATVSRAPELLHGKTSIIHHVGKGLMADIPTPFIGTRYHSLAIEPDTLPADLEVTGTTESGVVMSIEHRRLPISGIQFHPESVLTEHGYQMLGNWLEVCGDRGARLRSHGLNPIINHA
jgi:para-aminobenzoate synthetase component 2